MFDLLSILPFLAENLRLFESHAEILMKHIHTNIETGMLFQVWLSINLKCYVHPQKRYNCRMHTKKKV